jgi:hypothetical protein
MNNIFLIAAVMSFIFLIIKFIEMRFVEKESKPLKELIRDAILVYFSVVSGHFILNQINPLVDNIAGGSKITQVFTDNPGF